MRTKLATTALVRRQWACGFVLVLSLFSGIAADASTHADPMDHASFCDCGPKCRRDRCCCRPSSDHTKGVAEPAADESAMDTTEGMSSLCRMTSRCEDPVESQVRANTRTCFGDAVVRRLAASGRDSSFEFVQLPETWTSALFAFRLERPPKVL